MSFCHGDYRSFMILTYGTAKPLHSNHLLSSPISPFNPQPSTSQPQPHLHISILYYSTLLSSLHTHLTTLTAIADEHLRLADSLQAQVIDELRKSGEKKEAGRRKVVGWVEGLGEEREGAEGEVRRWEGKVSFERGWVGVESLMAGT